MKSSRYNASDTSQGIWEGLENKSVYLEECGVVSKDLREQNLGEESGRGQNPTGNYFKTTSASVPQFSLTGKNVK